MNLLRHRVRYWLPGILISLTGVGLVRLSSPVAAVWHVVGYLLAWSGLFVLAFAINRRMRES